MLVGRYYFGLTYRGEISWFIVISLTSPHKLVMCITRASSLECYLFFADFFLPRISMLNRTRYISYRSAVTCNISVAVKRFGPRIAVSAVGTFLSCGSEQV
jgi:hypothetical protein